MFVSVDELIRIKKLINEAGLQRSSSLKLWMMVETPANVLMLDKFIEVGIDGVSIGSNDLTMLLLGTDRDNPEISSEFNEMDPAVLWSLEHIIKTAHKYAVTSSICGQGVSNYPELVRKVVSLGISSISVSPDAIDHTKKTIVQAEKELLLK